MVPIASLWLPVVVSAVIVFLASSVIHMMTPFHKGDFLRVPDEDKAMSALRALGLAPGDYAMPKPASMKDMGSPEFQAKMKAGPPVIMTVRPASDGGMGSNLALWFVYSVVIGVFTAYVTGRALAPGTDYLRVFQIAGCVTFLSYGMAVPQPSIWYGRSWGTTARGMIDALIYGALTAGTFGWLWPR